MDWHNTDLGLQEQFQDLSGADEIAMNHNLSSVPEYNELGALFGDLPFFPLNRESNAPSQFYTGFDALSTPSGPANAAPGLQSTRQENQTDNYQRHNHNQNSSNNVSTATHPLLCDWPNCKKPGPFSSMKSLKRHIKTQHIAPGSFICPHDGCTMSFNRKDNLDQHLRSNSHWKKV